MRFFLLLQDMLCMGFAGDAGAEDNERRFTLIVHGCVRVCGAEGKKDMLLDSK